MGPACCECCEQILITRSISNQSAYLSSGGGGGVARHSRAPNRDLLRAARSSPDLHQNLLLAEQGAAPFEHIRVAASRPAATKSLGYMTSIRHRLSNASSLFKYREESRAARISILVVIMFLVSYIPFGLLVLAEGHDSFLSTYQQTVLAIFFVVLANIVSPLIFAYRNKRVRRGIQRLVSVRGRTGCGQKERAAKGDTNHGSMKEPSEPCPQNNNNNNNNFGSPKVIKPHEESPSLNFALLHGVEGDKQGVARAEPPRRKLVIFNGRNGQITRICNPEHHKNFVRLKGCAILKGYGGAPLGEEQQPKNLCTEVGRNKTPPEIGCSKLAHCPKLQKAANQRHKVTAAPAGRDADRVERQDVSFQRRIRDSSAWRLFRKTDGAGDQAMPAAPNAPQVSSKASIEV